MQPASAGLSPTNNSIGHPVVHKPCSQSAAPVKSTQSTVPSMTLPHGDLPQQPDPPPLRQRVTTSTQAAAKPLLTIPTVNGITPGVPWGQGVSASATEDALKIIFCLPDTTDFEVLGSGATADVRKITINTEDYAVKISKEESELLKGRHKHSFTIKKGEICGLDIPPHPSIMKTCALLIFDEKTREYCLISNLKDLPQSGHDNYSVRACIMELLKGRDLFDCLYTDSTLAPGEDTAITIGLQVIDSLQHLHEHGFIYRDLKPENIFYNSDTKRVKLVDYGLLKHVPAGQTTKTFCGTPNYMSPEVILHERYDHKVDNFALGMLLYELATGGCLFHKDQNRHNKYKKIIAFSKRNYKQRKTILIKRSLDALEPHPKLVNIISRLTCRQASSRMTLPNAIKKLTKLQQKTGETQV